MSALVQKCAGCGGATFRDVDPKHEARLCGPCLIVLDAVENGDADANQKLKAEAICRRMDDARRTARILR
jgi:hypothetical protein